MSTEPMTMVLATQNEGKCREFNRALNHIATLRPLSAWTSESIAETGDSFVANAILKARHAAGVTGLPALADDSGLCVLALQGRPGLYSARFAGADATDAQNNQHLLSLMEGVDDRRAYFHCTLVMVRDADDMAPRVFQGEWHGVIQESPRGEQGFGYDPLFVGDGLTKTAAEMTPVEKQQHSHRGRALAQLMAASY